MNRGERPPYDVNKQSQGIPSTTGPAELLPPPEHKNRPGNPAITSRPQILSAGKVAQTCPAGAEASVFQFRSLGCGLRVCGRAREVHSDTASAPRTSWSIALHNSSLRPGSASELPTQQNEKRQPLVGKKVKRVPSSFLGVEDGTHGGIDAQDRARRRTKSSIYVRRCCAPSGSWREEKDEIATQRAKHQPGHPGPFCAPTTHEVSVGHRKLGGPQGSAPARDTGTTRDSTSRFGHKVVGLHSKPLLCRGWPLQTFSWSHD